MCGIAGIIGNTSPPDLEQVKRMNAIQAYRGPNSDVVNVYPGAVLGGLRLSIIDLSDNVQMPMQSNCGRYVLILNGEIYNYKELRRELSDDYHFKTQSDSEVLLAAFVKWGDSCLKMLNGMFAFCIYDLETQSAFFARDRFGQKPLHYVIQSDQILFASEIKALLEAGVNANPDYASWSRYLQAASYDDTEATFFENIKQLRPGECATWSHSNFNSSFYYNLVDNLNPVNADDIETSKQVKALMLDAVKLHMRSDVPVGVSLSGGLDSSSLLACIEQTGKLHQGVHCASVDFGGDFSEEKWIKAAADQHGLISHIASFTPNDFLASIRPMMWHLEGPLGGLMNCALGTVMRNAHLNGTVVIQDGTGLDEAFAGYRNHHNMYLGLLIQQNHPQAAQATKDYASNWNCSLAEAEQAAIAELTNPGTAIDGTIPVRPDLLTDQFLKKYPYKFKTPAITGDALRDSLVDYIVARKIPRNTRMKDRISMAYSLELRLPFLDHRLIEYALSLPPEHYFLDGKSKSIVRKAMAGIMDDSVRLAHKRSIQAPQGLWLKNAPMKHYVEDLICSESFADRGIFDPIKCQKEFDLFCKEKYDNSFFVWQWINVEEWFRIFIDKNNTFEHATLRLN